MQKVSNNKEKIKIESHGISPWHYHLENMSWGFCRGKGEKDDIMAYLNVDQKLANGGQGLEDILMADFLNTLSFMPVSFMNEILSAASGGAKPELDKNAEVRGNAGNYYIPYEDEKNGIKLAFKVIFVCICIVAGQASLDAYHSMK